MPPRQQHAASYGAIVLDRHDSHETETDFFETPQPATRTKALHTVPNDNNEFASALKHLLSITTCQKP